MSEQRVTAALETAGVAFELVRHGPVGSLAEAASARGVPTAAVVKTLVLRRGEGDYLFVLVPGDRQLSWPKLRSVLGVSRMSLPPAADALAVTGYERGTITPFGSATAWPVVADAALVGQDISLGAGAHGVAVLLAADEAIAALDAEVADVSDRISTADPDPSAE